MKTEIKQTWFFNQSPQEVWVYLTKAELIAQWLMPNNFEPVIGHDFEFRTNPMPNLNLDGIMYCKVTEIIPFKKLSYTWKAGPKKGTVTLDTMVEWTLEMKDKGTELHLTHSGFKEENISIFTGMTDGWNQLVQKMINQLNKNNHAGTNA